MLDFKPHSLLIGVIILVALARPAAAFGAGNIASISKVEGQNWRHGDIEDALLTLTMARALGGKKFSSLMVSRTYFGNWLRDYSQAIDVGTVKSVSAEAIRLLLCVLGFLEFGYGSAEFEVTAKRLGCYRPEDHIDNPKDYAENEDARRYDPRLRGPVDERVELAVDPETGMKNYIANESVGIMTSAKHVRQLFRGCIELGRRYRDSDDKRDLCEALRLMGTGLHCLEDFFAHSNYCELALIEMGEENVFPQVGRDTLIRLEGARGPVYPIVTGTFGGVDFLHSVTGEVSDKMTQNEIEELEGTLNDSQTSDTSMLRELLDKIPDGFFGDKNQSAKVDELQSNASQAQMQNMNISPREPEEFTRYVKQAFNQVMPAIEFHDEIMQGITSAIEKIPILPKLIEQLEEQLSKFVFSIIAPFVVPLIHQIQNELRTGSDEIIQSSEKEQHIVFHDDSSTNPTHSMLSKDHFSNILNEAAGRCAAKMVHWVVPQLMEAIDDDGVDIRSTLDRIVDGIMHHPAQRAMGHGGSTEGRRNCFQVMKSWWGDMGDDQRQDYRRKLSRRGVENGENHKEGVYDTGHGHGCAGKLKMRKLYGEPDKFGDKIAGAAADAIFSSASGVVTDLVEEETGFDMPGGQQHGRRNDGPLGGLLGGMGQRREERSGGDGPLGGMLAGAAGSLLSGAFGGGQEEESEERRGSSRRQQRRDDDNDSDEEKKMRRRQRKMRDEGGDDDDDSDDEKKSRRRFRKKKGSDDDSDGDSDDSKKHRKRHGSHERKEQSYGRDGDRYTQEERVERHHHDGRREGEYRRYEQQDYGGGQATGGYGYEERTEQRPSYGGGYESRTERREYSGSNQEAYGGGGGGGYGQGEYGGGGGGGYGGGSAGEYERQGQGGYGGGEYNQGQYGGGQGYEGQEQGYGRRDEDNYGGDNSYNQGGGGGGYGQGGYGQGGYGQGGGGGYGY